MYKISLAMKRDYLSRDLYDNLQNIIDNFNVLYFKNMKRFSYVRQVGLEGRWARQRSLRPGLRLLFQLQTCFFLSWLQWAFASSKMYLHFKCHCKPPNP